MIPTVGFNMRKITKGNVTIKVREGDSGTWEVPARGGEGGNRLGCWRTGERELKIGTVDVGGGRSCDLRVGETAEGKLRTQWLSVVCLLLRPPSPYPLLSQLWDIGGQPRFRSMWERYCRGVSAIV